MTPVKGLAALAVAFTAGLSLTLVVIDSSGRDPGSEQRIDTSAADGTDTAVALADVADRSLLRVGGEPSGADGADDPAATDAQDGATAADGETEGDGGTEAGETGPGALTVAVDGSTSQAGDPAGSGAGGATQGTGSAGQNGQNGESDQNGQASATNPASTTSTSRPATATAPTTTAPKASSTTQGGGGSFESIRNNDPLFNRYADVPSNQLSLDALTIATSQPDNGDHPDGNFRMACAYSHFGYDDPIVFPGQPGKSHLHMFFGNTRTNAHTTTNSLVNSGGGSCNGFELNRSGYWVPAMLDGRGNTVVPDQIILYYKTKHPTETKAMPQGLKMIAGNPNSESFTANQKLGWSCGASGTSYNKSNRIPNNCGSDPINAYIQFPFCWDGRNLDSADHMSHMTYVNDNQSCPSSHPVRLPQITFLLYYPPGDTSGWYLSSDRFGGFNTGGGATLHGDWFGGWNDEAMDLWIGGCIHASRNCSYGQTGTSRMFAKLNNLQIYDGNNVLPLP